MDQNDFHDLFTSFILEHKENVYRLAFSYVKNSQDTLDIVQDSIQKALTKGHLLTSSDAIKSWFYRIVVNTSLDLLRKQKKYHLVDEQFIEYHGPNKNDLYPNLDLERALEQLPMQYREVIVLRFFEDLKIEEVANVLDIPISTAKTRIYHSLKLLRIEMEDSL